LLQDIKPDPDQLRAAPGDEFVGVKHVSCITCLAVKSEIKVSYCSSVSVYFNLFRLKWELCYYGSVITGALVEGLRAIEKC
jgi:hypothetical protein